MSAADGMMVITTTVTFPDDTEFSVKMGISQELYVKAEIPIMIEDSMIRASRALNKRIQEQVAKS